MPATPPPRHDVLNRLPLRTLRHAVQAPTRARCAPRCRPWTGAGRWTTTPPVSAGSASQRRQAVWSGLVHHVGAEAVAGSLAYPRLMPPSCLLGVLCAAGGRLYTVFSAPNYPQFGAQCSNPAAVAVLSAPGYDQPRFVQYDAVPRPKVRALCYGGVQGSATAWQGCFRGPSRGASIRPLDCCCQEEGTEPTALASHTQAPSLLLAAAGHPLLQHRNRG